MNIEKIKNYNQGMMAILFTLGAILLVIGIIAFLIDLLPHRGYNEQPQGLISDENVEALIQENLRKQIISYESPWLIDTVRSIYIVPVEIKTLKKPEEIEIYEDEALLAQLDLFSRSKSGKGYYNKHYFNGNYANLIIYNPVEEKCIPLFNERIIIGDISSYYFQDDILLVFYAASKDTDKNGIIDLRDLRNLCVYSLNTGVIDKILDSDNQVENYKFVENSKDLLIEFRQSQYKKEQFDNYQAPTKIMKYDYVSKKLTNAIPEDIQSGMQKLVEGK